MAAYRHRCSPKKFTQHQLFACLVLKNSLQLDYRGVTALLTDSPTLVEAMNLTCVPHYTTLQKAAKRLLGLPTARRLLSATVRLHMKRRKRVARSAMDSTGLECSAASGYFVRRRTRAAEPWKTVVYHHFPKLGIVCDTDDHFVLAFSAGRGPRPDVDEFRPLLGEALRTVRISRLAADAGYDSEPNHRAAREDHGVRTIIPAKHGRPTAKLPSGYYRRLMKTRFDRKAYRHRTQVETVMSMIKRRQGAHVRARTHHSQRRDLHLMALNPQHHDSQVPTGFLQSRSGVFYSAALFWFQLAGAGIAAAGWTPGPVAPPFAPSSGRFRTVKQSKTPDPCCAPAA